MPANTTKSGKTPTQTSRKSTLTKKSLSAAKTSMPITRPEGAAQVKSKSSQKAALPMAPVSAAGRAKPRSLARVESRVGDKRTGMRVQSRRSAR